MEVSMLFAGILYHSEDEEAIMERLSRELGAILVRSENIPFDFTSYYEKEMGKGLLRKWLLFDLEIEQGAIADLKQTCRAIEKEFSKEDKRRVNIDPGYVTLSKVVLPTTKDCAHRIFLKDGIYAEITLLYFKGGWQPQTWTYRDYCSETAISFFNEAREHILSRRTL